MKLKIFQKGFNYSQDGQGNRLIFHLQGCNMKCPWCSNPEGMPMEGAIVVNKDWLSASCCPLGAVQEGILDRSRCVVCEEKPCTKKRRQKGIQLSYKEYEVDDLIVECISSKAMFFDGGGVTLTGGEITMQFDAVKEFLITPTLSPQEMAYTYASEADILNMALFGKTAAQWRSEHDISGKAPNIRDFASAEELVVLINLEDTNADLIRQEVPKLERLKILREKAYRQLELLKKNQETIKALKQNLIEDTNK